MTHYPEQCLTPEEEEALAAAAARIRRGELPSFDDLDADEGPLPDPGGYRSLPAKQMVTVQSETERRASVYPDEERREWVRRKMREWAERHEEDY